MDPMTLILAGIPSLIKGIFGITQMNKASKIESQYPRPTAEIAPAINEMVNYNKGLSLAQDIPGGTIARNQIGGATAAGINAASRMSSGSEGIGAMNQMVASGQNQYANLGAETARYVAGRQGEYANSLGLLGQEQNRVWEWNKAQPYLNAQRIASELRGSGAQNMFGGVSGMFGAGAAATAPDFFSMLNSGKGIGGTKSSVTLEDVMKAIQGLGGKGSYSYGAGFPVTEGFTS